MHRPFWTLACDAVRGTGETHPAGRPILARAPGTGARPDPRFCSRHSCAANQQHGNRRGRKEGAVGDPALSKRGFRNMRTPSAKPAEALAARTWWVVDADGQPLGRIASKVATIL